MKDTGIIYWDLDVALSASNTRDCRVIVLTLAALLAKLENDTTQHKNGFDDLDTHPVVVLLTTSLILLSVPLDDRYCAELIKSRREKALDDCVALRNILFRLRFPKKTGSDTANLN